MSEMEPEQKTNPQGDVISTVAPIKAARSRQARHSGAGPRVQSCR